jgi:hypothetical protein
VDADSRVLVVFRERSNMRMGPALLFNGEVTDVMLALLVHDPQSPSCQTLVPIPFAVVDVTGGRETTRRRGLSSTELEQRIRGTAGVLYLYAGWSQLAAVTTPPHGSAVHVEANRYFRSNNAEYPLLRVLATRRTAYDLVLEGEPTVNLTDPVVLQASFTDERYQDLLADPGNSLERASVFWGEEFIATIPPSTVTACPGAGE